MTESNTLEIADDADPFPSFTALRAAHSELLQRDLRPEQQSDCLVDVERFIQQAEATGEILSDDEERRGSQNILNYWASFLYRFDSVPRLVTIAKYNAQATADIGDVTCPYPGVRAFEESESQFFFGRQRQINYILNRLKEDRVLVLVGPSGSGKTSLVNAGVVPTLKKDDSSDLARFYFAPTVPGSDPLGNLARMVQRAKNGEPDDPRWVRQQVEAFRADDGHLLKLIENVTDKPAVIFIDQGEELYELGGRRYLGRLQEMLGFSQRVKIQRAFLGNLLKVVQSQGKRHIVVLARRIGDYEPHFRRLPKRFKEIFEPARMVLPPLYASELSEAIEKPAELFGVTFEGPSLSTCKGPEANQHVPANETTVQALIKEVTSEPAGLPLLQFTLSRLWEKREGDKIPAGGFENLGGCRVALATTAENFFTQLDFLDQRACRRLLKQLVTLDGELRAHTDSVRRQLLYVTTDKRTRIDSLLERLIKEQLIQVNKGTVPSDDVVELAHASLLTSWPRMVSWIERKRLARRWSKVAAAFFAVVGFVALCVLAVLVWGRSQEIEQSRDLARRSGKQFSNNRLDLALLLGREGYKLDPNETTRSNTLKLLFALQSTSHPSLFLRQKGFDVDDLTFSAENGSGPSMVGAIQNNGDIVIWNLNSPKDSKKFTSTRQATYPLAFSPDNKWLVTASEEPGVAVIRWEVATGNPTVLTQGEEAPPITGLGFSPDGKSLVTGSKDGNVVQWDLSGPGTGTALYKHSRATDFSAQVSSIVFNAGGTMMASGSSDGTAILWDLRVQGGHPRKFAVRGEVKESAHDTEYKPVYNLAFSPDGNLLAAAGAEEAFVWNIKNGEQITEFSSGPRAAGMLISFSADGKLLAAFSYDGTIILWDVEANELVGGQLYKPASSSSAAFSADGKLLALPSEDGLFVWDVYDQRILNVDHAINSIAFSHGEGNQKLAAGAGEGSITLWRVESSNKHKLIREESQESGILSLAFSADDRFLAAGLQNGTIRLMDPDTLKPISLVEAWSGKLIQENSAETADTATEESKPPPTSVSRVVFSPDPNSHVFGAVVGQTGESTEKDQHLRSKIIFWDAGTNTVVAAQEIEPDFVVTSLAFSNDGKRFAAGITLRETNATVAQKKTSKIMLWQGQKLTDTLLKDGEVSSLAFASRGKILAVGFDNGRVLLCDGESGKELSGEPMDDLSGSVTDLVFSADGKMLASGTNKTSRNAQPGSITLWDVESREVIGSRLVSYDGPISGIAFSPNDKILASGNERSIVLWDVDLKGAGDRFCTIVNCDDPPPEVAEQVQKKSWPQWLYIKASRWWRG